MIDHKPMRQTINNQEHILNARPDTLDFRDQMYVATLNEVPTKIDLNEYRKLKVPILDQGQEGHAQTNMKPGGALGIPEITEINELGKAVSYQVLRYNAPVACQRCSSLFLADKR
jgi:hypothetical protein